MIVNFTTRSVKSLKPCPFCGGDVSEADIVNEDFVCFVMCGTCGASSEPLDVKVWGEKLARRKTVEAWNTRAYEKP